MKKYKSYNAVDLNHNPRFGEDGGEFELNCLFDQHDPRRDVLKTTNFQNVQRIQDYYTAILSALEQNPTGYTRGELQDPPSPWMNAVHFAIVQELRQAGYDGDLIVMPTLKTSADIHHGVDALIVFTDDLTHRSVIITVDLSLKPKKEHLKAAVLVHPYGATPNRRNYSTPGVYIGEEESEFMKGRESTKYRREIIGTTIGRMIIEKLQNEDPCAGLPETISVRLRNDIQQLLHSNKQRPSQTTGAA